MPFGRSRFFRLSFGISSASEVFQKVMNRVFDGLEGMHAYYDDVLVWGVTQEEHNKHLCVALAASVSSWVEDRPGKMCL